MFSVPVADIWFGKEERKYLSEVFESGLVSGSGPMVQRFEAAFAERIGVTEAVACCNGTVALHLALLALDVQPGDEVIVPDLTYVATANAVRYCGATPVFADVRKDTWCISGQAVSELITPKTVGVIPVHLYGQPSDMLDLNAVADHNNLFVVEDAAQAHGATLNQLPIGRFGDAAIWSFYGNKIITTGEGGMVCTNSGALANRLRKFRGHCVSSKKRYWFDDVGYNYRIPAVCAALGLGQLERLDEILSYRRAVDGWYRSALASLPVTLPATRDYADDVCWLFSVVFEEPEDREATVRALAAKGIETRPFFPSLSTLPFYKESALGRPVPINSRWLADRGLNLPTGRHVTEETVEQVSDILRAVL